MADTAYERVLCVKNEVLVYRIPPRPSNRGYRADDWKLDAPDWTGRLRVVSKGEELFIKLEDKTNGELFAQCPVDAHPGIAVEPVMDSSRYFVLRIKDDSGRSAFIGIGFHDRSDSFDLNVSLQDHFKWLRQEKDEAKNAQALNSAPKLDLGLKEGQTITLNLGTKGKARPRPAAKSGDVKLLPPPPRAGNAAASPSIAAPPSVVAPQPVNQLNNSSPQVESSSNVQNVDLLLGLGASAPSSNTGAANPTTSSTTSQNPPDLWGDFIGAGGQPPSSSDSNSQPGNWIQF